MWYIMLTWFISICTDFLVVYNKHKHTEIVLVNDNGFWFKSDFVKKETDNPNIAFTFIDYKNIEIQQK